MIVHFEVIPYYHNLWDFSDCHTFDVKIEKGISATKFFQKIEHFSNENFMVEIKWPTTVIYYFEVRDEQLKTAHLFFFGVNALSIKFKTGKQSVESCSENLYFVLRTQKKNSNRN